MNPKEIETTILNRFDVVSEIGVFTNNGCLEAVIYPNFQTLKENGTLNIHELMRLDVIDRYNRHVSSSEKIQRFTLIKKKLPKTPQGDIQRTQLVSLLNERRQKQIRGNEPNFREYLLIKEFLYTLTEQEISPDDHLEIDLVLSSLDKVRLLVFLEINFGIMLKEGELLDHFTAQTLAEYIREKIQSKTGQSSQNGKPTASNWGKILSGYRNIHIPRSRFPHTLILNIVKTFVRYYFRLRANGIEHLSGSQVILASNHQCFFDGFILARFLTNRFLRKTYVYAAEKHFNTPFRRFVADTSNVIIVNIDHDLKRSLQKMAAVLRQRGNIIIFPEGTRTKDGCLGPFKNTFAILSREFQVPIVPVVIQGAFEAMPIGSHFPKPLKKINVTFLPPVYPENLSYETLTEKVSQSIKEKLT